MPFIEVIDFDHSEGTLREIYEGLIKKRGKLAEVHKIQSLNPESITAHMDLYMKVMFAKSPLKRYQREMMAVVVSASNQCPYCITHHAEALLHFWKDSEKVNMLGKNWREIELSDADQLLCHWAEQLTINPASAERKDLIDNMKQAGISDRAILDGTLVVSYFNFVNRMVLGLGVDLESDGGGGYSYD